MTETDKYNNFGPIILRKRINALFVVDIKGNKSYPG